MLKKFGMLLLAVALVFGLTVGCGGGSDDGPIGDGEAFEFEGPFKYYLWGSTGSAPTLTAAEDAVIIEANTSTGFGLRFDDMGYTLNRTDTLVITYHIEVETPIACLNLKQVTKADNSGVDFADVNQGITDYGIGKGREVFLGHDTASVYEAPSVSSGKVATEGTWDPATKTGTFEIKLSTFGSSAIGIGFQHNYWCEYPEDTKSVAENSKYTVKFLKVENLVSNELLAPVITTQPASARIAIGSAAPTLTVAADEVPAGATRTYQWQKQDGDDWTDISGATGTSLATGIDTSAEGTFRFRAVVSNVRGTEVASTNSTEATVTVYDPGSVLSWEDVLAMELFSEIWSDGAIEFSVVDDGIKIEINGGAVKFDVDAVRTAVGVDVYDGDDADTLYIVRVFFDIETDGITGVDTQHSGGGHTGYITYTNHNTSTGDNPWFRFDGEVAGVLIITDIQIATEAGWGKESTLKSIFDWLDTTGLKWEDVLAMELFSEIWSDGAIEFSVVDDGIKIEINGGAVKFDVDAVRTAVGVDVYDGDDADTLYIVRVFFDIETDGITGVDTQHSGGGHTGYITYTNHNTSTGDNPWFRFDGEEAGVLIITDIKIATEAGWGKEDSLKSIFEWL